MTIPSVLLVGAGPIPDTSSTFSSFSPIFSWLLVGAMSIPETSSMFSSSSPIFSWLLVGTRSVPETSSISSSIFSPLLVTAEPMSKMSMLLLPAKMPGSKEM